MHQKCPYCETDDNDFVIMNDTTDYSGIEMAINRQGMLRVRLYSHKEKNFISQDIVNIEYCPGCGKRFGR
jgi:hypothetical protein